MKLIIALLVLSCIALINASNQVNQLFTLSDSTCTSATQITLNNCTSACGTMRSITYNLYTGEYKMTSYANSNDRTCNGPVGNTVSFNCTSEAASVNDFSVECSQPSDQVTFSSFKFSMDYEGYFCNITAKANECINFCDYSYGMLVPNEPFYGSYLVTPYSDEKCETDSGKTRTANCLEDIAFDYIGGGNLICQTENADSSASIINYSIALLFSIFLLNFLL